VLSVFDKVWNWTRLTIWQRRGHMLFFPPPVFFPMALGTPPRRTGKRVADGENNASER